jgi:hypothetical protein
MLELEFAEVRNIKYICYKSHPLKVAIQRVNNFLLTKDRPFEENKKHIFLKSGCFFEN